MRMWHIAAPRPSDRVIGAAITVHRVPLLPEVKSTAGMYDQWTSTYRKTSDATVRCRNRLNAKIRRTCRLKLTVKFLAHLREQSDNIRKFLVPQGPQSPHIRSHPIRTHPE